jgi:hypothetical protein
MKKFITLFLISLLSACGGGYVSINYTSGQSSTNVCPVAPLTQSNVADVITSNSDLQTNILPAKYHFVTDIKIANSIAQCSNGYPSLVINSYILDPTTGLLLPNALNTIQSLSQESPDLVKNNHFMIEVSDEPFWNKTASDTNQAQSLLQAVQWLRQYFPSAQLGITLPATWNTDPNLFPSASQIIPYLDWVGMDTYSQDANSTGYNLSINNATQFAQWMDTNFPNTSKWLIFQGFSPTNSPTINQWSSSDVQNFENFISTMNSIANQSYNGWMAWGWSNVNELPPQYAGKYFPSNVQSFYLSLH